ncbi:hypothetical protein GOODEAATRI_006831 [Goodea atripinnis]|uniref:Uncharacterized protein n=1 Tax=Goodea atripinnis TaxID=208336 RepID=A0ABV0PVX1_9TELE
MDPDIPCTCLNYKDSGFNCISPISLLDYFTIWFRQFLFLREKQKDKADLIKARYNSQHSFVNVKGGEQFPGESGAGSLFYKQLHNVSLQSITVPRYLYILNTTSDSRHSDATSIALNSSDGCYYSITVGGAVA